MRPDEPTPESLALRLALIEIDTGNEGEDPPGDLESFLKGEAFEVDSLARLREAAMELADIAQEEIHRRNWADRG